MWTLLRTLLLFLACVLTTGAARNVNVTINKCCKFDESVPSRDFKCVYSNDVKWDMLVYVKKTLKPYKDRVPDNWILRKNHKPDCKNAEMWYPKSYIPFLNGSLWSINYNTLWHPDDYCLDYTSAIVCKRGPQELESKVKINECCGPDAIFYETNQTCVVMKGNSYIVDVGSNMSLIQGFPDCSEKKFGYADKLNASSMLLANGSLVLKKGLRPIPPANFCVEHVMEKASKSY